jgi:hypothetical protein
MSFISPSWQPALDAFDAHRSYAKCAEVLGVSEATFRARLYRARKVGLVPNPPKVKPRISVNAVIRPRAVDAVAAPVKAPASQANSRVLILSDLHAPYCHPDALAFLAALKAKYNPDRVVCVGDEVDHHSMSFHDSDPDLDAAGRELQNAREILWELAAMFPKVDLVDSNHGSLLYRRGKASGIPRHLLLEYKDAIFGEKLKDGTVIRPNGRGEGWNWHHSLVLDLPGNKKCLVVHGMSKSTMQNVKQCGMNFIQGHHHGTFEVVWNGTPDALNFGMTVGCLIDDHSLAFAYNKTTMARPIIGCGIILDGQPRLLPMVLAKGGRWSGYVP